MLPILQRGFLFISFHLLGTRGPKQKGGENSGLTSCVSGQNGNQLRTPAFSSAHFVKDVYDIFATLSTKKPRLIYDKIGVVAVPKYTNPDNKALSARDKRKVRNFLNT